MWRPDGFAFRHATKGIPTLEGEKTLDDAVRFVSNLFRITGHAGVLVEWKVVQQTACLFSRSMLGYCQRPFAKRCMYCMWSGPHGGGS